MNESIQNNSNTFNDVTQLERAFIDGKLGKFPQNIVVHDITYHYHDSTEYTWEEIITAAKKPMSIYTVTPSKENLATYEKHKTPDADDYNNPKRRVVLLWSVNRDMKIAPTAARFMTRHREMHVSTHGFNEGVELGFEDQITINNINNNQPIPCKIDTGADMCSLHAEDIRIVDDVVSFTINGKQYRMPLAGTQTIKQADSGHEKRPTVTFDFQLAGQIISGVECNLNDRSNMSPMLVGKNLLSQGDFTIDTELTEGYKESQMTEDDWSYLNEMFSDVMTPEPKLSDGSSSEEVENVIKFMLETDCSMKEVIHHIKQDVMVTLNKNIQY